MIMFTFAARIAQKIAPDDGFGGPAGTGLEWNALKFFPAVLITHTHTPRQGRTDGSGKGSLLVFPYFHSLLAARKELGQ